MSKSFLIPASSSEGFSDDGELIYSIRAISDRSLRLMLRDFFAENPSLEPYEIIESWQDSDTKGSICVDNGDVL